jgi:hypothetical protein
MPASEKLRMEIVAIGSMPREELVGRWTRAYGHPPPKGVKRALLERAAAWHLQAKHLGGLSAAARRMLRASGAKQSSIGRGETGTASVAAHAAKGPPVAPKMPPVPGTRLLREWNGRMHVVEVVDGGFLFDGKSYRSLTAVARRITGMHRSGPGFFGL